MRPGLAGAVRITRPMRLTVRNVLRSLRLFALPMSLLAVGLATAAALPLSQWNWPVLLATAACVCCLHLAGNLLNDYFDFRADRPHVDPFEEARPGLVLLRGDLLPGDVLLEAALCLALAAGVGAYLVWHAGAGLLWFAAAGVFALYAYTGPPFKLKRIALGELTMVWAFGPPLGLAVAYAQTRQLGMRALLVSLVPGLAAACTLAGNNFRDRVEDARAGVTTLAAFAAGKVARAVYVVLAALSVALPVALAWAGQGPPALLASPVALLALRRALPAMLLGRRMPDIDVQTARFGAILLAWMFIAYAAWPAAGP